MSYCRRFQRLQLFVLDFRSWAFSHICGNFQQHFYCACAETAIYEFVVKFLTPSFDSPISLQSAKCQRLGDDFRWFFHFICWMSAIFLLAVCLTYWPRKYTTRIDPHGDNSHQVWSWKMTIHCRVKVFCLLIRYVTLWPWPLTFDLLTLNSCHTWRVTWPTLPPILKTLRLFALGYYWHCVFGYSACAVSPDLQLCSLYDKVNWKLYAKIMHAFML